MSALSRIRVLFRSWLEVESVRPRRALSAGACSTGIEQRSLMVTSVMVRKAMALSRLEFGDPTGTEWRLLANSGSALRIVQWTWASVAFRMRHIPRMSAAVLTCGNRR